MSVFVLLGAALRKEMTTTLPHLGLVQIHSVCNGMKHYNNTCISTSECYVHISLRLVLQCFSPMMYSS